jgi:transcription elongation factor SPT6
MATPGRASIRQTGRTPNPYGGQSVHPSAMAGRATPAPSAVSSFAQTPLAGYQTPFGQRAAPPSAGLAQSDHPVGMNPQRAALIQNDGGWGTGSGGW